METTKSNFIEVLQQPVSIEQVDPDLHVNLEQGMAEHGQPTNVNIDHGSTTHLDDHSNIAVTTHSHCQQDTPWTRLHTESNSSPLVSKYSSALPLEGETDPTTQLDLDLGLDLDLDFHPDITTHLPDQTADSGGITSDSINDHKNGSFHTQRTQDNNYEDQSDNHADGQANFLCVRFENDPNGQLEMEAMSTSSSNNSNNFQMETEMSQVAPSEFLHYDTWGEQGSSDGLKEKFDIESLNYELQVGYKILMGLMGAGNRCVNKLFLHPVDEHFPETADYYDKIKEPMWMVKMKEKFESLQYTDLIEFMTDFRLMIENCYRFNGPDHFVSKKAQKLELMMKQKIALLSKDLREKLMGTVSTDDDILSSAGIRRRIRNPNATSEDPSQQLLSQLRKDKVLQDKEDRKQRSEDKKAVELARIQGIKAWEEHFMGEEIKESLRTMWEIPQLGLFVYLCMETLGLDEEITQYQLERGLVAPRECSDFKRLMTCLLSTPYQRKSLKGFMPYHVWNRKLAQKVFYFYKILSDCNDNNQQACYKLGFDNRAFKIMGRTNPMLKKSFHELSFRKRVWILKSFCDFCLETQSEVQKTIEEVGAERPMDVREVLLGSDGRGYRYINFPMFTGKDIRIYRYPKLAEPSLKSLGLEDWSMVDEKPSNTSSRCSTPVNPRSQRLYTEQPCSSLRARAIMQAAESKEASPMRDASRTSSDFQDENSNSNMDVNSSISSELTDGNGKRTAPNSSKKRKKSSHYSGKRKRLKGNKKTVVSENHVDAEKEEERSLSPVPDELQGEKEKANINANTVPENDEVCDNNAINGVCDVRENLLSDLAAGTQPEISEEASDSESNMASSNPAHLFHTYSTNVDNEPTSSPKISTGEREVIGMVSSSSGDIEVKNHDSAYLSCDSDKSFKSKGDISPDIIGSKLEFDTDVKKENDPSQQLISAEGKVIGKSDSSESVCNLVKKDDKNVCDSERIMTIKSELDDGEKPNTTNCADAKLTHLDSSVSEAEEKLDIKNVKTEETPTDGNEDTQQSLAEIKEEIEEEESDEEDIPDLGSIELVAESMEEMRLLIQKLSNPDPIKRGKRVYAGVIKPCEEELLANLSRFYEELMKYERSLYNARVHAQIKLRKEIENYVEPKLDDGKGWESEVSQSSKESSEDEDLETKKVAVLKEKPKKSKRKATAVNSTSELLSSAANKLSSINGDANEDSNDSYELDISSRGRLRKRRVIPNNTEDTCLRKRKNLSQDLPSASVSSSTSPTLITVPGPSSINAVTHVLSSSIQQQQVKSWPQQVLSVMSSPSNSAIKAQLTSPSKSGLPCQIVRLVSPSGDASYKTVHLAGKRSMVLSPENMANIRFVSSTGVVTVPKNSILSSSSAAHSSHPVIHQLLLNQARRPMTSNLPNVKTTFAKVNTSQIGAPQTWTSVASTTKTPTSNVTPSHVKVNLVSPSVPSSTLTSTAKTSSNSAVVVTQVSTSISHGGKQILDLGSLSVTQIQQLVKNQAIQINTGAGSPTTLLLTKGLQQLATSKISTHPANTTLASTTTAPSLQIKMPLQRNLVTKPEAKEVPAKSLLSSIPGSSKPHVVTIPGTLGNQTGSMTVLSSRQVAHQLPVIRTIINRPIQNAPLVRAVNPPVMGATIPVPHVVSGTAKLPAMSQGPFTIVPGGAIPRQIPAPRIISSLQSPITCLSPSGLGSANKENPPILMSASSGIDRQVVGSDPKKPSLINIPFSPLSSPPKKYASNVTVKALLENRTYKKPDHDGSVIQGDVVNLAVPISKTASNHTQETAPLSPASVCVNVNSTSSISAASYSFSLENSMCDSSNDSINLMKSIKDKIDIGNISSHSVVVGTDSQNCPAASSSQIDTLFNNTSTSSTMQPLSVETAIQPLLSSSVQVSLPTVNIKIPSPNTLPSLTHNKNSTIIVQSTKVPIPVASAHDSSGSLARMVTSMADSVHTATSNSLAGQISTQTATNPKTLVTSSPSGSVNVKNVMLKLTPPKGPFVQGFMTSKGKLVIPQNALLQQHPQVIQASPNRVILANAAYGTQLQTNQLQARPGELTSNLVNQNVIKKIPFSQNSVLQSVQQQNGQVVMASQPQVTGVSAQAIPIQNGNPGIKVMLINQSNMSQLQQGQTNPASLTRQEPLHTNTPASELVKQIANSTQMLATGQQQGQQSKSPLSSVQQNTINMANASVINFNPAAQSSTNSSVQNLTSSLTLKSGHSQASVSPQLAAQILALQQSGKGLQVKQVQAPQQQSGFVLAAKPASVQQQQSQSSLMAVQLQQLGSQLIPGVGGIAQVQVPTSQLQHAAAQIANAQAPIGAKAVQHGQVVQLALNPQPSNPSTTVLNQSQAQIVQVAGQLSPHLQLANQGVSHLPHQQGGIILQQPNVLQNQQQAVITPQNASVLPIQINNLNQQKTAQPFKQSLIGGVALAQQPQLQGSQAQIQLVINPSVASSTPLSIGTVLRKPAPVSTVKVPQLIRTIVNPATGMSSAISSPRLLSPTKVAVSLNSSTQTVLGTAPQLSQVMTQNVANANQLLISPVKFAPQMPQINRATSVKFINASPVSLQSGSTNTNNQNTCQLVQKIQFNNSSQGINVSQGGTLTQKPMVPSTIFNTSSGPVGTGKIAHRVLSQPSTKLVNLKQIVVSGDLSSQSINSGLSQFSLPATQGIVPFPGPAITPSKSNEQIMMPLPVQPMDNCNQNLVTRASHQQQHIIRTGLTSQTPPVSSVTVSQVSVSEGNKMKPTSCLAVSTEGVNGNRSCVGQLSHSLANSIALNETEGQTITVRNRLQENGVDAVLCVPQTSSVPEKHLSGRRHTFSESQNNAKTSLQRNTSVDESSTSFMSKEMDEKEAALNLLTLANQQM